MWNCNNFLFEHSHWIGVWGGNFRNKQYSASHVPLFSEGNQVDVFLLLPESVRIKESRVKLEERVNRKRRKLSRKRRERKKERQYRGLFDGEKRKERNWGKNANKGKRGWNADRRRLTTTKGWDRKPSYLLANPRLLRFLHLPQQPWWTRR